MCKGNLERNMQSFTYGSRVITNELYERLNKNVKRLGNAVRAFVKLFGTVFVFLVINAALSRISHYNFLSLNTLRVLNESAHIFDNNDSLSMISYLYRHALCFVLAIAIGYAREIALLIDAIVGRVENDIETKLVSIRDNFAQNAVNANRAIAYRDKVCFLS